MSIVTLCHPGTGTGAGVTMLPGGGDRPLATSDQLENTHRILKSKPEDVTVQKAMQIVCKAAAEPETAPSHVTKFGTNIGPKFVTTNVT